MALGLCRFTNAVGGTADFEYPGPSIEMQSPASAGAVNGTTYKYYAHAFDGSEWEIGTGAYTSGTGTFARTSVQANSLGDTTKIDFTNPPHVVILDLYPETDLSDYYTKAEADAAFLSQTEGDARYVQGSRGHILGEASNDPADAGEIGEYVTGSGSTSGNFTSGAPKLIGTIPIPSAGDWDIWAHVQFSGSGGTSTSSWSSLLTTEATPTVSNSGSLAFPGIGMRMTSGFDYIISHTHPAQRLLATGAATLYLHGQVTITAGTVYTANCTIFARRAR